MPHGPLAPHSQLPPGFRITSMETISSGDEILRSTRTPCDRAAPALDDGRFRRWGRRSGAFSLFVVRHRSRRAVRGSPAVYRGFVASLARKLLHNAHRGRVLSVARLDDD